MCENPLAMTSQETAERLRLARESGLVQCTNYNVRFYPLLQRPPSAPRRQLGRICNAPGTYAQDWLHHLDRLQLAPLSGARPRPLRAVADIGTHWLDLAGRITGRRVAAVCADF